MRRRYEHGALAVFEDLEPRGDERRVVLAHVRLDREIGADNRRAQLIR